MSTSTHPEAAAAQAAHQAPAAGPNWPVLAGLSGLGWGAVLMLRGDRMWTVLCGRPPTTGEATAMRLLAARHLIQGTAQLAAPRRARPAAIALDLLHGTSMVVLAVVDRSRARPALLAAAASVASACMAAAAGVAGGPGTTPERSHPASQQNDARPAPADRDTSATGMAPPRRSGPDDGDTRWYAAQQQLIDDLLMLKPRPSPQTMERLLREGLQRRGIPSPPETWIQTVTEKLAEGRLYVVAARTVDVRAVAEAAPGDPLEPIPPYGIS